MSWKAGVMWFILLAAFLPRSEAQEAPTTPPPAARLSAWGEVLPMDPGVSREMTRFRDGSLGAPFARTQAGRLRRSLLEAAEASVERWEREGCRPRVEVSFPEPEAWGISELGPAERGFLAGLVRTEAVACFLRTGLAPREALDLYTNPAFRMEVESRIERIWEEGDAFCLATNGVPVLLSPTAVCNRVSRLADTDLAAEHSQVIRNGGDDRLQPVYFKESLKTFVATNDGLGLHYINYSRSADLGNASRWIAGGEVRKSQERQIEALRKRIEME